MMALTLTQPWATLVALRAKRIETRDWSTPYRGPLAIHAAKGFPHWAQMAAADFAHCGYLPLNVELPLGYVVATCRLADCILTETVMRRRLLSAREEDCGDFSPGRWAWLLADVRALPEPIPARGSLALWEWDETTLPPAPVSRQLAMALGIANPARWRD